LNPTRRTVTQTFKETKPHLSRQLRRHCCQGTAVGNLTAAATIYFICATTHTQETRKKYSSSYRKAADY
jgi:hypothetical protein